MTQLTTFFPLKMFILFYCLRINMHKFNSAMLKLCKLLNGRLENSNLDFLWDYNMA